MELIERLQFFNALDAFAVCLLVIAWAGIDLLIENPGAKRPSVATLMADYRRAWFEQLITRDPRIFDSNILSIMRQGASFFASACMIAIGGGLALIGNTESLLGVASDLTLQAAPAIVWEVKLLVILLFVANAFLKFVWSLRLFGYCAVVMASVPNDPTDPDAAIRAAQSAEINITASRSFNRGMRSIYFALSAVAWLLGAWALIVAVAITLIMLWRREFASHSRTILLLPQTQDTSKE